MANPQHLEILKKGVETWNTWRMQELDFTPDLRNAQLDEYQLGHINFRTTNLSGAQLNNAQLNGANLEYAILDAANLQEAKLVGANLKYANLNYAQLEKANLSSAQLEGASLQVCRLAGANLQRASFDAASRLDSATFSNPLHGFASLADIRWGETNLAVADWASASLLGEETKARKTNWNDDYRIAVRAYRQLAVALREQGLNEEGDTYAYRAQLLQRAVWRQQKMRGKYLFSYFLDIIAGYGYRPLRSIACYAAILVVFACIYFLMGAHHNDVPLPVQFGEVLVASMMAFHSRGFMAGNYQDLIGDNLAFVAAIEGLLGLLIEFSLIATFTQRFFAK
jgi:uncharacterized protein YjbI with pentapeptide repeats